MIRDKQTKITWHVDNPKMYHADKEIVDDFIECTKKTYDDVTKLESSRSNIHDSLTMTLVYMISV